jgi:uncharacterized protein (DUF58 family)
VSRSASPKLAAYAALAGLGLLAALALGRAELAALAAPFAAMLAVGLSLAAVPEIRVRLALDRERQLEGERVELELELAATRAVPWLDLLLVVPPGLVAEAPSLRATALAQRERQTFELPLRCERWGAYLLGDVALRGHDRFGLLRFEQRLEPETPLKVYPLPEAARTLLRPLETQAFAGSQVPRLRGEGIEFADLRPFVPGDRVRRVNWRATARRGEPWVNELHPERNSDVVLFLDTFAEARRAEAGTLDRAVRATASLAFHYLREKDRVGFVAFGGILKWLTASTGTVQLYRIVDSLIDAEIFLSYAWKEIDVLPSRTLPPHALVLALSPLLDERSLRALLDLRARGFDLAVIEVSPVGFASKAEGEREELAYRLWQLKREALRARYERVGVPVVEWRTDMPLEAALAEVGAFRRQARYARA